MERLCILFVVALSAACVAPPPVDDVLRVGKPPTATDAAEAGSPKPDAADGAAIDAAPDAAIDAAIVAADARAAAARAAAQQLPDDPGRQLAAARRLWLSAELRAERSVFAGLAAEPPADLPALFAAEDRLAEPWQSEILSLAAAGTACAERAVAAAGSPPAGAQHYLALHLGLTARAQGVTRSLFQGLGPRLARAAEAAVAADEAFAGGAPLVLRGRFLMQAPWPYGDRAQGLALLRRAFELGPTIVGAMFLGDALWQDGEPDAARAAWRRARDVPPEASEAALAPFQRRRVELRLALAAAGGG